MGSPGSTPKEIHFISPRVDAEQEQSISLRNDPSGLTGGTAVGLVQAAAGAEGGSGHESLLSPTLVHVPEGFHLKLGSERGEESQHVANTANSCGLGSENDMHPRTKRRKTGMICA